MIVYAVRHRETGKTYVGQTVQKVLRRWTCHKSHAAARPRKPLTDQHKARLSEVRSGERYATKLTWEKVREIRRLYATGEYSQPLLASMFDCGTTIIWAIVNNKKWIEA